MLSWIEHGKRFYKLEARFIPKLSRIATLSFSLFLNLGLGLTALSDSASILIKPLLKGRRNVEKMEREWNNPHLLQLQPGHCSNVIQIRRIPLHRQLFSISAPLERSSHSQWNQLIWESVSSFRGTFFLLRIEPCLRNRLLKERICSLGWMDGWLAILRPF